MDACTVAAFDAITAFAVPNLGGHLATPSIFSGLAVPRVASLTDRPVYFKRATDYGSPLFSTVDYGCHIGYALAANSCERVAGVDTCTVASLDAITAFAVPNLGGHLATPSIFSGLAVPRVASLTDRSVYFKWATD
jgi:hypothetical protein